MEQSWKPHREATDYHGADDEQQREQGNGPWERSPQGRVGRCLHERPRDQRPHKEFKEDPHDDLSGPLVSAIPLAFNRV